MTPTCAPTHRQLEHQQLLDRFIDSTRHTILSALGDLHGLAESTIDEDVAFHLWTAAKELEAMCHRLTDTAGAKADALQEGR